MNTYRFTRTLCLLLSSIFAVMSLADAPLPPPIHEIDRDRIITQATEVTKETYPNAEEVLLEGVLYAEYNADGTYSQWDESYVKILTEEARRSHQIISTYFTIPYQRGPEDCRIDLLEIIKADGSSVPIDVKNQSRVMTNPGSMSQNIYNPNDKVIRVNISGLETGDILHYRMFDRIVQPRMTNTWGDWIVFESTVPIIRKRVEVKGPPDRPLLSMALKAAISNSVTQSITTNADDSISYKWTAQNIPRMFPEPNMPSMHTVVQRQLVSTVPDWESISRWYWELSEPHLETSPAIRDKVQTLIEGLRDDQQKINAIFQFVSQQIRYMGITVEATAPGYEPHDVRDTFDARHGVCRDKAALLVAMLRVAGIEAFPTLIHNGPKKDPEVPLPYFNHAIVAVRNSDGNYQLMDPTDENTRELLPGYLNEKSYLVATPEGDSLRTSAFIPATENMMLITTDAAISDEGCLTAKTQLRFEGINDNAYRGAFAGMKPEDRINFLKGRIMRSVPSAVISSIVILPEDMTDTTEPLSIAVEYSASEILIRGRSTSLLPLPALGTSIGMVNYIIGQTGLQERKYPLTTEVACGVQENITIQLPTALSTIKVLPDYQTVNTNSVCWAPSCTQSGNTLNVSSAFILNNTEYSPEEYLVLKEVLKTTERDIEKMPILDTPEGGDIEPDSIILDAQVEYRITSPSAWTETRLVKRKILSYAGKKRNAELKIGFNPAWENVELTRATVTSSNGTTKEISQKEINIMDAPWAGSAPRYPAAKTMIASFPAVEIGSVIEFELKRTYTNRPFFSTHEFFRIYEPIQQKSVRLVLPKSLKLKIHPCNTDDLLVRESESSENPGCNIYEWTIHNAAPVKREDLQPPWYTFNPTVFLSLGNWQVYAMKLHGLLMQAATDQSAAMNKARDLTKNVDEISEQIRVIRDFIAINIRSAGPSLHELPLNAISSADRTLIDGYGNTTDKAILFFSMLKSIGMKPEYVLASGTPFLSELTSPYQEAPSARFFPNVLVRLAGLPGVPEGTAVYLNEGNQYSEPGTSAYEGKTMLPLYTGIFSELRPSKPARTEAVYKIIPDPKGRVTINYRKQIYGPSFGSANQHYSEMPPEDRRRNFQEMVADISQSALATSELITDFSSYPGTVEFSVCVPKYAERTDNYLYFPLPASLNNLFKLRTDQRETPLYISRKRNLKIRTEILLPTGFTVESEPAPIHNSHVAQANIQINQSSGTVTKNEVSTCIVDVRARIEPVLIPERDYSELMQANRKLSSFQSDTIVLRTSKNREEQP